MLSMSHEEGENAVGKNFGFNIFADIFGVNQPLQILQTFMTVCK